MTIIGAHLERRRKSIKGYDGLVWGLFTSIFGFLSVVRLRRGRYLTTRKIEPGCVEHWCFFSRYIALLVTLFHCCWNLMIFGAFLSFGGLRKRWVSDMWNHRTDKLSLFSHGSSSAHPQEEMKKELILGGHHHVFFPPTMGVSWMNLFGFVVNMQMLLIFCVGTLQWKDLQFATLEQTWGWNPQVVVSFCLTEKQDLKSAGFFREYGC